MFRWARGRDIGSQRPPDGWLLTIVSSPCFRNQSGTPWDSNSLLEGILIFALIAALQLPGKLNFGVVTPAVRHPHCDVFVGASIGPAATTVVSIALGYRAETVARPYLL